MACCVVFYEMINFFIYINLNFNYFITNIINYNLHHYTCKFKLKVLNNFIFRLKTKKYFKFV